MSTEPDSAAAQVEDAGAGCEVETLTLGPFQSNCYIVRPSGGGASVVIDPGDEPERILARLGDRTPAAILLTHAHLDHIGAVAALVRETGAPVYLHEGDRFLYDAAAEHARAFGLQVEPPPAPDAELKEGDDVSFGPLEFEVRHAPGHSPGHVVLVGGGAAKGIAFVGDCVFAGSIGRTDLPGGDMQTLLTAIRRRILTLPDATVLYPGHMGPTTVSKERQTNPFLVQGGFA